VISKSVRGLQLVAGSIMRQINNLEGDHDVTSSVIPLMGWPGNSYPHAPHLK